MKAHRVLVNIVNAAPVDGRTDPESFIGAWKEAEGLFREHEHLAYKVTVDATDTLQLLYIAAKMKRRVDKPFKDRLKYRMSRELSPFGSQIALTFRAPDSAKLENVIIKRFLENLYLAMNLSVPGSCNLHRASFQTRRTAQATRIWSRAERDVWLDLSSEGLECAYQSALKHGWPRFQRLELGGIWEWLERGLALWRSMWLVSLGSEPCLPSSVWAVPSHMIQM